MQNIQSCTSCRYFGIWSKECYKSPAEIFVYDGTKTHLKAEMYRLVCKGKYYFKNGIPKLKLL